MKITKATTFRHVDQLVDAIRTECTSMQRMTVNITQVRPGDMIATTGEVVRQVFDHVFDPREEGHDPCNLRRRDDVGVTRYSTLVQFTQVQGLSVLEADRHGLNKARLDCITVFRPVQPEDGQ